MRSLHPPRSRREPALSRLLCGLRCAGGAVMKMNVIDLMFTAVAIIPVAFAYAGRPVLGVMTFCPLLIATCLLAAYFDGTR